MQNAPSHGAPIGSLPPAAVGCHLMRFSGMVFFIQDEFAKSGRQREGLKLIAALDVLKPGAGDDWDSSPGVSFLRMKTI